jgi:hypothetical protein
MSAMEACAVELIRHANDWFRRIVEAPDLANGLPLIATKQSLALIPPDSKVCPDCNLRRFWLCNGARW